MKVFTRVLGCICLSLAALSGCTSGDGTMTASDVAAEASLEPDLIHRAITLSHSGEMETALDLLLEGTESEATLVEPLPCLGMGERAFIQLPSPELDALKKQNIEAADAARALARAAAARVAEARAGGDAEKADRWAARIEAMGHELSKGQYNALLRLIGPSIIKTAAKARSENP